MKNQFFAAILLTPAFFSAAALAQDDGDQTMFAYATYFVCTPDRESRADEIVSTSFKPHYDAAVEHGDIVSWSWLKHFIGGQWRRVLVIVASDIDAIIDSSGALGEIIEDRTPEAGRAFSAICSSHEDYIWRVEGDLGYAPVSESRGAAGFSSYMECDMSREERADELVREVFGPLHTRHIGDDGLTTWNWIAHHTGGPARRALILGASDHKTLMRTRDKIVAELGGRRYERAMRELNEICHTHHDYLWDILFQTP